jgi:peptide deformylase
MNIIAVPNPVLRQKSKKLVKVDKKTIKFTNLLIETLLNKSDPPGVGLSAIQVGKPTRLFITYLPRDPKLDSSKWTPENLEIKVYINPVITKASPKTTLGGSFRKPFLEGCLSIPNIYGPVPRYEWIEVSYQTLEVTSSLNHQHTTPIHQISSSTPQLVESSDKLTDFPARVFQHELDHLNGILFTDYTLKENLPLYFDQGDDMLPIQNPKDLIKW